MTSSNTTTSVGTEDLTTLVARKIMVTRSTILLFVDFTVFMAALLKTFYKPGSRLVAGGHVTPEIDLAANRAEIELIESLGPSSFSSDPDSILKVIKSPRDLIYIANPNRLTGANFSLSDLEMLARAIPQGTLFIDEHYFDYFGISGFPLLDLLTNVVILRSFTASFGISSSEAGFILANPETINVIKDHCLVKPIPSTVRKTISTALSNKEVLSSHIHQVHEESLRLATALSRLKVQCRITAADFFLMRVADPKSVGKFLARYKAPVDNLDSYPQLENYLRYRIQSPLSNDRLIEAFKKMPADYYRMKSIDRRGVTLRRHSSSLEKRAAERDVSDVLSRDSLPVQRSQRLKNRGVVTEKE
jgi:histidinol-phosphate/aromatic aminotransferase/cobyric acid decarboxylase-like protein